MIAIKEDKHLTHNHPIVAQPLPQRVYIPLIQHTGRPCSALVKVGDMVRTGERIGSSDVKVFACVHASVSGKVVAIDDWPHPTLGRSKAIVIESDGLDTKAYGPPALPADKLKPDDIRKAVFEAGIAGMGGAGFPTHIKLSPPKPVDTLIINGAECEPHLTADFRLMLEKSREICLGIGLVAKCLGVKDVFLAIEDNKPEAVEKFRAQNPNFKIKILKSAYPQGGEKQLIKNILGREVPRGKLPFEVGVVVQNVATIFAIYEAAYLNKPLYERVVTVTGTPLSRPRNILARLGTPIKELIDFCGPLKAPAAKIITGGPMMGVAQYTDSVPVIKGTSGIVLFDEAEAKIRQEEYCIRCGACVRGCPAGLMPCLINLASEKRLFEQARIYAAKDCIECGLCNYVCPSHRRLVESIRLAKIEVLK